MTEYNRISSLTLSELEPYITGKKFTGEAKKTPRMNRDVFEQFGTMLEQDAIVKEFFDVYENYKDFYKTAVDFRNLIPKELQMEAFYAAKIGCFYVEIPSFCVFMLKKANELANGMPNLILKYIPFPVLTEWFKEGYFLGGLTLRDAICNVGDQNYEPLCETKLKNKINQYTEIYVKSTDMVAAVPNRIADLLDDNGILAIEETPNGLSSNGVLLRTMGGYVGAINSKYDLRQLI